MSPAIRMFGFVTYISIQVDQNVTVAYQTSTDRPKATANRNTETLARHQQ